MSQVWVIERRFEGRDWFPSGRFTWFGYEATAKDTLNSADVCRDCCTWRVVKYVRAEPAKKRSRKSKRKASK